MQDSKPHLNEKVLEFAKTDDLYRRLSLEVNLSRGALVEGEGFMPSRSTQFERNSVLIL